MDQEPGESAVGRRVKSRTSSSDDEGQGRTLASKDEEPYVKEQLTAGAVVDDPPDGGLQAWLVVLGGWCTCFATWGQINQFGVFQEYLSKHQLAGYSPSAISWLGSLQLGLTFGCAIFAGRLFDAGYMRPILVVGTVIYIAGFFGLANATQYWQFLLAQGFANGLGCGLLFLPAGSCISHWWKKRRALAFGVITTGSSCGGILYPSLLSHFLKTGVSFAWSVRILGFITLALLAVGHATLRTRLPPRQRAKWVSWEYFKDPAFDVLSASSFLLMLGLYVIYYYLPSYTIAHGVDANISAYSLTILNAGSLFGRLIPNYLADHYGPHVIIIPHCFASGVLVFCWQRAASTNAGTIVLALLYGWTSGAFVSQSPACLASIVPNMNEMGIALSMYYVQVGAGVLFGNPIAGAILNKTGSYDGPVAFAGSVIFAGSIGLTYNWYIVSKRKGTKWV